MQGTYETVCTITSFGFNRRWRRKLLERMSIKPGMHVCDMMAGMGETWPYILRRTGARGTLLATDFSGNMVRQAERRRSLLRQYCINVREEDALHSSVPSSSTDAIVCAYGVKTLSPASSRRLAVEMRRILAN